MADALTIAIAGDVMLGRYVDEFLAGQDRQYPWGDVLPALRNADLRLVNLECALTAETEEWRDCTGKGKAFYFRANPDRGAKTLDTAGIDFAALANNHAGDYGTAGLLETVAVLDGARVAHAGAGVNLAAARLPARLNADGLRVAVVAFADHPDTWAATPTSPGINYLEISTAPATLAVVEETIAAAREDADVVIASFHWGPNMRPRPTPLFREFARRVVDAGADLFWGHSAHVVQGIEIWHGKPILYDTGDFVDDYAVDPGLRNDLSALFLVRIAPPAIARVELLPVRIDGCRVNRVYGRDREWFAQRVRALCAELGTLASDDGDTITVAVASPCSGGRR
jgi:poly-gamma-glutamate capsule biosynthesis protein CapA/YwtB (metallophosphatase superfamily)